VAARDEPAGRRAFLALVKRIGVVQMDSVNVLVRSHYMPAFSRLGRYDPALLDEAAYASPRALFEYWGHAASLLPLETYPLLRWRMERARSGVGTWGSIGILLHENPAFVETVRRQIEERGALAASDFEGARGTGSWWGWSDTKRALEALFWSGAITTRWRRPSFERVYDLTDRVIPARILATAPIAEPDAQRELIAIAARAQGVATEYDLRDYFRLGPADARARIAELVEAGRLVPVDVEDWRQPAYLAAPRVPRRIECDALLSPFDSLVWNRPRTQRLFGFDYRIEIYTPSHGRIHGYYVLPYLLDEKLVARVDLKADRATRTLLVLAAHYEPGVDRRAVRSRLRERLGTLCSWLKLDRVTGRC